MNTYGSDRISHVFALVKYVSRSGEMISAIENILVIIFRENLKIFYIFEKVNIEIQILAFQVLCPKIKFTMTPYCARQINKFTWTLLASNVP